MKFKELRESLTSRMVSMAVKHTTPKKKPVMKEGRADDAFGELDKEIQIKKKPEPKSSYPMDNDGGAVAPKNFNGADKYMDKGPSISSVNTNNSYMDKGPAVSPSTPSSSGKTMKFKDLPELDKEQWRRDRKAAGMPPMQENSPEIGDGIYLELDDVLIETEIVDETEDGYIIYMDQTAEDFINGINEAEYQGRDVPLNKPMPGDVAKSKVYVKGPSGRVVKVNFGDKNMTIKKNIPARRKSFRARHRCETPGPKHKARYWSCKAW